MRPTGHAFTRRGRLVLGLLVLVGLFAPAANALHTPGHPAQPMQVSVEHPRGLFDPLGGVAVMNITVRLDCTLAQSDTPINFTVRDQPSWLFVRDMPGWRTVRNNYTGYNDLPCDPASGYITIKEPMVANFTSYAPAYRFANFTVVITRSDDVKQALGWLQPGYYGMIEVVPPPRIARVSAQADTADLEFRVRNHGNGETTARISIEVPAGVTASAAEVLILGAAPQGGEWDRALAIKLHLHDVRDDFTVTVNVTGFSRNVTDQEPARADQASTTVDMQRGTPAPGLALAAGAAVAAALLVARRRRVSP